MKLLTTFFFISFFGAFAFSNDMTLVYNNQEIILHEDETWDFADQNAKEFKESFNITLNDNRIIRISTDYSWRFVAKNELNSIEFVTTKNVSAKGNATHPVLAEANARAMENAVKKASVKLKASVKNRKLNLANLTDCVKRVEKDVDKQEKFTKGTGWNVKVEIALDKGSILSVLDCEAQAKPKKTAKK
ncbi:MAG: hypothetical protein PVI26_08780 [Chitinispirillia bacterium]